jgi:hypothetical protein
MSVMSLYTEEYRLLYYDVPATCMYEAISINNIHVLYVSYSCRAQKVDGYTSFLGKEAVVYGLYVSFLCKLLC